MTTQYIRLLITRMPKNIYVRSALPTDAWALASIHSDSSICAYSKFFSAAFIERRYAQGNQLDYFEHTLQRKDGKREVLVAIDDSDDEILGVIDMGYSDEDCTGKVHSLFVHPKFMRCGIGGYLLYCGQQWSVAQGYDSPILWVFSENVLARKFYERVGWVDTNVEELTSWPGLDDMMCRKFQKAF